MIFYCIYCFLLYFFLVFFFEKKTEYDMRISDWSSDVCSSDLNAASTRQPSVAWDRLAVARVLFTCNALLLRCRHGKSGDQARCRETALVEARPQAAEPHGVARRPLSACGNRNGCRRRGDRACELCDRHRRTRARSRIAAVARHRRSEEHSHAAAGAHHAPRPAAWAPCRASPGEHRT